MEGGNPMILTNCGYAEDNSNEPGEKKGEKKSPVD
jgi:hypothetical protein